MGWKSTGRKVEQKIFGKGGAKRRYGIGKGKGGFKIAKLAADLEMVKNRLNVEKKHKDADVFTTTNAQANQDADGYTLLDVTPDITQGIDSDERIGNSLKLTGMTLPMSFAQQVNTLGDRRVRCTLLRVKAADNGVNGDEAVQNVWDVNPLTGLRDFNCPRAYRSSKTDGISVITSRVVFVKGPQLETGSNGSISNREMEVKNYRLSVKLNDILRYAASGDTKPDGIRYYLMFQCNAGNRSGSNSSLDIPITDNSSGVQLRISQRSWWVDN